MVWSTEEGECKSPASTAAEVEVLRDLSGVSYFLNAAERTGTGNIIAFPNDDAIVDALRPIFG